MGVDTALGIGSPSAGFNCLLRGSASSQLRARWVGGSEWLLEIGRTIGASGGAPASTAWREGERELNRHVAGTKTSDCRARTGRMGRGGAMTERKSFDEQLDEAKADVVKLA